mmetsp:Transcript_12226/g.27694  ORF Transcript_12226/g.27694 Transcript_12226/m.27694 type:complete len:1083 (+) Transcript_12226:66-3314(+)
MDNETDVQEQVLWENFAKAEITAPVLAHIFLALFHLVGNLTKPVWFRRFQTHTFVRSYIGYAGKPPESPFVMATLHTFNWAASNVYVVLWVRAVYRQEIDDEWGLRVGLGYFFMFTYFLRSFQAGFDWRAPWNLHRMIDIMSAVPQLGIFDDHTSWLSWRFMRMANTIEAVLDLDTIGAFGSLGITEFSKAVTILTVQTLAIVAAFAGIVFTLEVLGEVPDWEDKFYITANGDAISPFQSFYWMVTTVSTVGYGDFSPTTVLSRLFICLAIITGVSWFGVATSNLLELKATMDQGRDHRKLPGKQHVVIAGGGVHEYNTLLVSLLGQLYGGPADEHEVTPKTVLMASKLLDTLFFNELLERVPFHRRQKVSYFAGSAMVPSDLKKVSIKTAMMVIIVANPMVEDRMQEDGENLMRAMAILEANPAANLRLMLLNPESQTWAVSAGIAEEWCIAAHELKVNMLAQCCRCHGYASLLSLLLRADMVDTQSLESAPKWQRDFWAGSNRRIQGTRLTAAMEGMSWADVAMDFFQKHSLSLIAAQIAGKVVLNPLGGELPKEDSRDWNMAKQGDVVFVVGDRKQILDPDWVKPFRSARREKIKSREVAHHVSFFHHDKGAMQLEGLDVLGDDQSENVDEADDLLGHWKSTTTLPHVASTSSLHHSVTKSISHVMRGTVVNPLDAFSRYKAVKDVPGHTLVLLLSAASDPYPMQMVSSFIHTLRSRTMWEARPLIIMSDNQAPDWLKKHYPSVIFLTADVRSAGNLRKLQLQKGILSEIVFLMASFPKKRSDSLYPSELMCLEDNACVVVTHMMEVLLRANNNSQVYTVYELMGARSASLLGWSPEDRGELENVDTTLDVVAPMQDGDGDGGIQQDFYSLPGYAGGHLFTVDFVGQMLAMEATFPAVIELMESMIMPQYRGQTCEVYLLPLPQEAIASSWTYGQLVGSWSVFGGATLLGLYRELSATEKQPSHAENSQAHYKHLGGTAHLQGAEHRAHDKVAKLFGHGGPRASGSHRRSQQSSFLKRVVLACPRADEPLKAGDLVYVLAHPDWAKAHKQDLQELDEDGKPTWLNRWRSKRDGPRADLV